MKTAKKEPVKIRQKQLANGSSSLYLDIYIDGKRSYEFLKLYLIPEKNKSDRMINAQTMQIAETVRDMRMVEIQRGRFKLHNSSHSGSFWKWLERCQADKRTSSSRPFTTLDSCAVHLHKYSHNSTLRLEDVDAEWCDGFRRYLESVDSIFGTPLKSNTIANYLEQLNWVFEEAMAKGMVASNPMKGINVKRKSDGRTYLTLEELQKLVKTDTKRKAMKRAFLFSCLTGLRVGDIKRLRWANVTESDGYTRLIFQTQKTATPMYLDIDKQAAALLGERKAGSEFVFGDFFYYGKCGGYIREWARDAGIDKPLTFHSARHTFAVLMLSTGTDIYTVSKLLGHADVTTTQIYAKVLDKARRDAVDRIPTIMGVEL